MAYWKAPTQNQIDLALKHLQGNLKAQFFTKLENPLWFEELKKYEGLLWYEIIPGNGDTDDSYSWPALPYLIRTASEKPVDIYNFLQPLIDKINACTIETFWFVQLLVFSIAPKMQDEQFVTIISVFASYIEQIKSIGWFDYKELHIVFERIKGLEPKLADKLAHNLLCVHLEKWGEHGLLTVTSKYGTNNAFRYNEILNLMKRLYDDIPIKLFDILTQVISHDLYEDVSDEDRNRHEYCGYIYRPAIEDHEQNHQYYETEDNIINAIRELAIKILTDDLKQIDYIFNRLESSNRIILIRVALYLLSNLNDFDEALLSKYLTNYEFFDGLNYHHEYFHLIKSKFGILLPEHQNEILSYIESGPTYDYYKTNQEKITAEEKQKRWRFNKLVPILEQLTDEQKERFASVIYDAEGKQLKIEEHPDFLTWMEHFEPVIHKSPIDIEEIKDKSIPEIISIMQNWQPVKNSWINGMSRQGLAKVIQEDIKQNPKKYILGLEDLKVIKEPTYVRAIIRGILDSGVTEDVDWVKLIKFCEQVVSYNEHFEGRDPFHDGDENWYWTKQEVVSVFSSAFREKSSLSGVDGVFLEEVYKALRIIVEAQDENLEEKRTIDIQDRLHTAINSLHGQAVEALLIFVLWLKNNGKPREQIFPLLNKLVSETCYLETFAIIARMISNMYYAIPEWVVANIDKIFPTGQGQEEIFKTTWHAFILYGQQCNSLFGLIESKFTYALSIDFGDADEGKRIREHTAQGLAYYYGCGLYSIDSDLLGLVFNSVEKQIEQVAFMNYVGFSLWDKDGRGYEVSTDVLTRFRHLWEWFIEKIKDHKADYKKVLVEFERWYQCGRFKEHGWAINQLHSLVMDDELNLSMACFMLEDNLLQELPQYPRKVFDIISRLVLRGDRSDTYSRNDIVVKTLDFIKNHEFTEDMSLKSDKDSFINKMLEQSEAWEAEQKEKLYRKYLEEN